MCDSSVPGRGEGWLEDVTLDWLDGELAEAPADVCGPLPFMRAVRAQLLERGVEPSAIHYEVFGPDMWLGQD
ncbi:hypothetical protein [Streptomyces sparsogenes]|uniref:hypothetical protein n=1 Tax=Streptomyces sparsogenes TaxID=67365 RepID=UPI003F4CC0B1